jgi:hypothetical protein
MEFNVKKDTTELSIVISIGDENIKSNFVVVSLY